MTTTRGSCIIQLVKSHEFRSLVSFLCFFSHFRYLGQTL